MSSVLFISFPTSKLGQACKLTFCGKRLYVNLTLGLSALPAQSQNILSAPWEITGDSRQNWYV